MLMATVALATNLQVRRPAGKARIDGLPNKARPLAYDIRKGVQEADVVQNVESDCHAAYDVTLK